MTELNTLLQSGSIPLSTQVCAEGAESWQPISALFNVPTRQAKPIPSNAQQSVRRARGHSVFYYVFWGTLSLGATLAILFFGFIFLTAVGAGFLKGLAGTRSNTAAVKSITAARDLPALTEEETKEATKLLGKLQVKRDDIEGVTWYLPEEAAGYATAVYLYIGIKNAGVPWLRLKIRYHGDGWLFIHRYRIKINQEEPITLEPSKEIKRETGSGGSVWEIFDDQANTHAHLLNQVLVSDRSYVRMEGTEGKTDFLLGPEQLQRMRDVLLVYRHLGGAWPEN